MHRKRLAALEPTPSNPDEHTTALQAGASVLAEALDALAIHTIILDGVGRCTHFSPYAQTLLSQGSVLTVSMDRLRRCHRSQAIAECCHQGGPIEVDHELQPCLDCVTREAAARAPDAPACSIAVTGDHDQTLHLRLSPLPFEPPYRSSGAAAILTIQPLMLTGTAELQPDAALLLTPAEREVATELLNGRRPAEIAQRRNVTIDTIRSQIKRIYAKLGVSGLVEFMASARR